MTQSSVLTIPLIACLNHLIRRSDLSRQQLQLHVNKVVHFHIESLVCLYGILTSEGYFEAVIGNESPVVTLELPAELVPRFIAGDPTVFHEITISGDTKLANHLLYLGKLFQLETAECLNTVTGDILAHRIILIGQKLVHHQLNNTRALSRIFREFMTEEQATVINYAQFHQASSEIETLQQRILQLEKKIGDLTAFLSTTQQQHQSVNS